MTRTPEPYDKLSEREKAWIEAQNPSPGATLDKDAALAYLRRLGFDVTPWTIKMAIINRELPSKLIGQKRMVSEFDLLVWQLGRDESRQEVSA